MLREVQGGDLALKGEVAPESNIREKLDGKAVFLGLPQIKKTAVRILGAENRRFIRFGKCVATPESNIRGKLDGNAVFSGLPQTKKNGGKNFGGGKQEGNSLWEVWERPALKTCFSKNFGTNTGNNPLREVQGGDPA